MRMGLFRTRAKDFYICSRGYPHLRKTRFEQFDSSVLGLGDLRQESRETDAIAVVFDLAGFTKFCNQIDPQLAISEFLAGFLDWLFGAIKEESVIKDGLHPNSETDESEPAESAGPPDEDSVRTFTTLPFFAKFMGDGVLFLWDTKNLTNETICSVPSVMMQICSAYELDFLPKIAFDVSDPPTALRCGIARGKVFSVGNGQDFVGPCINMASRLQKTSLISIAFSRRGFPADKYMDPHMRGHFVRKKVAVRGIGDHELVYVDKDDYEHLPETEKGLFTDPDEDWRLPTEAQGPTSG